MLFDSTQNPDHNFDGTSRKRQDHGGHEIHCSKLRRTKQMQNCHMEGFFQHGLYISRITSAVPTYEMNLGDKKMIKKYFDLETVSMKSEKECLCPSRPVRAEYLSRERSF
jgi:hypothetical protein